MIDTFPTIVRLLGNRTHGRPDFCVSNEYDAQDLLFAILGSTFETLAEKISPLILVPRKAD